MVGSLSGSDDTSSASCVLAIVTKVRKLLSCTAFCDYDEMP